MFKPEKAESLEDSLTIEMLLGMSIMEWLWKLVICLRDVFCDVK